LEKLELEKSKLQFDIDNGQRFPPWILAYLQPLMPSLFTLASIVATIVILSRTKFFENANTLYEIRNQNLKAEGDKLEQQKVNLEATIHSLQDSTQKLSNSIAAYKSVLNRTKHSMNDQQLLNAQLSLEVSQLTDAVKNVKYDSARLNQLEKRDFPALNQWYQNEISRAHDLDGLINSFKFNWDAFSDQMVKQNPALRKQFEQFGYKVSEMQNSAKDISIHDH